MFTPIGFFKAPSATTFDPSLGGTLDIAYHWDFTDSSTMGLSGTDVTTITDKLQSIQLSVLGANSPATFNGSATVFGGASSYYKEDNWVPDEMTTISDFTVVQICTTDFNSFPANKIITPWAMKGTRGDGWGHNNLRMVTFTPGYDPYFNPSCDPLESGGTYYFTWQRFDGGWTGKKQIFQEDIAIEAGNMITMIHDYTNTDLAITLNNYELCLGNDFWSVPDQSSGKGFEIGSREGGLDGWWYGDMYHTMVYNGALLQEQVDALYAAWFSYFN